MVEQKSRICISGEIESTPEFSHNSHGEAFYKASLISKRLSGKADIIPVIVPELYSKGLNAGDYISIEGEIRSSRVENVFIYYVFATQLEVVAPKDTDINEALVKGSLIRKFPVFEKNGRVVISYTVKVMHDRDDKNPIYVNCCSFGRDARYLEGIEIGTEMYLMGRYQSREYTKNDCKKSVTELVTREIHY